MCVSGKMYVTVLSSLYVAVQDLRLSKCELCMIISDYLSVTLDDPQVEQSIDKVVERVCPLIPRAYQDKVRKKAHFFS